MNYRKYLIVSTFLSGAFLGSSPPLFSAPNPTNCRTLCAPEMCLEHHDRTDHCADWCSGDQIFKPILEKCLKATDQRWEIQRKEEEIHVLEEEVQELQKELQELKDRLKGKN